MEENETGAAGCREQVRAVALNVVRELGTIVEGGIAASGMKIRDVTGALKDLGDILGIKNEAESDQIKIEMTDEVREWTE